MKLYIHVPFCHSKCAYCDFYSTPRQEWMESYIEAVAGEWAERSRNLGEDVDTLYLGGGTPSSLPLHLLSRLIDSMSLPHDLREATIEANPEDVTPEWVDFIAGHSPFRRVSMGIQSFSDTELSAIGRRHNARRAINAMKALRDGGIGNISCDLIYGLPGQDLKSWQESLDTLIDLRPEHISAYLLSYEPGTRLSAMLRNGKVRETDEATVGMMYESLCDSTRRAGYTHYEISNFSLPGREAIHNSSYWDGSPYVGLGPGAHSWDGEKRSFNPPSLKDYIACKGRGFSVVEPENELNRYNDMLITRLRTIRGLHPGEVARLFGPVMRDTFLSDARRLSDRGLLHETPSGAYAIPEDKWLTSDSIMLELIKI